jgi:hypothetical protein
VIDLVCLVADKSMEAVVEKVLPRHQALGIRPIQFRILRHPRKDSACYHDPLGLLRDFVRSAHRGLVLFDRDWVGVPQQPTEQLEASVDRQLDSLRAGWAKAIVIDPELEVWLCSRSPRLEEKLGWHGRSPSLTEAMAECGLWPLDAAKPADPKSTIERALYLAGKPRSSSIYGEVAAVLGMKDCVDSSFQRFRSTLQAWFPTS